jgi:hypothetical protein
MLHGVSRRLILVPTPYKDFGGRLRSLLDSFAEHTIYNLSS